MRASGWAFICVVLLTLFTYSPSVHADEAPDGANVANMPQREQELINILVDARKQYAAIHSDAPARDARLAMQVRVIAYMQKGQTFQGWTGTIKTHGTTPEGDAWITIEIADGITISTWQKRLDDLNTSTLFRRHSPLYAAVQSAKIGQPIIFNGIILKSMLASDEEMVAHPQFIARFSDLKVSR